MAEDKGREVEPLYFDGCVCLCWRKEFMKLWSRVSKSR